MARRGASMTRRATLVLGLLALSAAGVWLVLDRGTEGRAASAASTSLPTGSRAEERGPDDAPLSVLDEPAHSRVTAAPGVGPGQALSAPAPSRGCRIHGRVIETGNAPVPGLTVWLVPADVEAKARYLAPSDEPSGEVTTGARGEFEFPHVAPGAWLVGPAPPRASTHTPDVDAVAPMSTLVAVRGDDSTQEIEIRVQRGLTIRGRVLQPDGAPAVSGIVGARSREAPGECFAPTRDDGTFTLGPLVSGQYELWADGDYEGTTSASVLAFAGDADIVLRLREGGSFSGRVVDERSGGGQKAMVFAMRQDIEPYLMLSGSSDADGYFQLENVASGRYQVIAKTEAGSFAIHSDLEVAGGRATRDLVLELREGGRLRLQRKTDGKVRVEIRQDDVQVLSSEITELDTSFAVPAGRLTIRWTAAFRPASEARVEIRPGAEQIVVLED